MIDTTSDYPTNPGNGYRFLRVGEIIQDKDEWFSPNRHSWQKINASEGLDVGGSDLGWFRREAPVDRKNQDPEKKLEQFYVGQFVWVSDKHSRFYEVCGVVETQEDDKVRVKYRAPQETELYTYGWFWAAELQASEHPVFANGASVIVNRGQKDLFEGCRGTIVCYGSHCQFDFLVKLENTGLLWYRYDELLPAPEMSTAPQYRYDELLPAPEMSTAPQYRYLEYDATLRDTDEQVVDFLNDGTPVYGELSCIYTDLLNKGEPVGVGRFDAKHKKFRRRIS